MLNFILGILVMSVFIFFVLLTSTILTGSIGKLSYTVYKKITLWHFRRNYLQYQVYTGKYLEGTYYIHKNVANFFYTKEDNHNCYLVFEKDCKDAKSLPHKRFKVTPRGVGRHYRITENFLSAFIDPHTNFYKKMVDNSNNM